MLILILLCRALILFYYRSDLLYSYVSSDREKGKGHTLCNYREKQER